MSVVRASLTVASLALVVASSPAACGGNTHAGGAGADASTSDAAGPESGEAGSSGGGADGAADSGAVACEQAAQAYCQRFGDCSSFDLAETYGDVGTCIARQVLVCTDALQAPGSGWTLASVQACAAAKTALPCADLLDGKPPAACQVTGTEASGAGCLYGPQCASGYCDGSGAQCGSCVEPAAAGSPCGLSAQCASNLLCATSGVCAAPVSIGGACDGSHPCKGGLSCLGSVCAQPHALGASCVPANANADCDANEGLLCNPSSKTCAAVGLVLAHDSCAGNAPTVCVGSGTCVQGTCVAAVADGAPCDALSGDNCMTPALCRGGTCVVPQASNCH